MFCGNLRSPQEGENLQASPSFILEENFKCQMKINRYFVSLLQNPSC